MIEQYIDSYNRYDVDGMLLALHPKIVFRNVSHGKTDLVTNRLAEFKAQVETAISFFKESRQTITELIIPDKRTAEATINYNALLSINLPNGMKAGDRLV